MNNLKLRKQLFESVRNIPYRIDIIGKDATCLAKNKLLGELLSRIGLKCKMIRGLSYWKDIPSIPPDLSALAPKPIFNHVFLNVYIPETKKWIDVDATWDPRLGPTLAVAKWDGLNKTVLACKVINTKEVGLPQEYPYKNFDADSLFTKKLNEWFETLRKKQ